MNRSDIALALLLGIALTACAHQPSTPASSPEVVAANQDAVYATYGVHNDPNVSPCTAPNCTYVRGPGEPADPIYPEYWVSPWTMYRVFNGYQDNPPPYDGRPPAALREGVDYELSYGASYYDSTWRGATGEGAMMEHYEKKCLPIFPLPNDYTCSFISLGNVAYFVTYPQDRPAGMPPVCLFSLRNHPPRRDFVKHLPYSSGDSERLGAGAQAYSFWVDAESGKPIQTGASPDQTDHPAILFGYAFAPVNGVLQPQSFYFSGYPLPPANAPIVSQNYTNFRATKPDPATTWNQVSGLDIASLPKCQLFDPPATLLQGGKHAPTWKDIGRWGRR